MTIFCQWIENGIQCNEIKQNDCRWCDKHLGDAHKWITKSRCIIDKKDELINELKNVQKIRDNLIGVQRELIEVLEEIIEIQANDSKVDKQLIAFLEDKYEPASDDEW